MKVLLLGGEQEPQILCELKKRGESVIFKNNKVSLKELKQLEIDFVISYCYRYLIDSSITDYYKNKIINLHISYLPWNKGADPNFWSFWDDTPKGVTIHYIDEHLDTGDIIVQKEITFSDDETLRTTYDILQIEIQKLLIENWEDIKRKNIKGRRQNMEGSFHYVKDFDQYKPQIGENWNITIKELKTLKKAFKQD